VDDARRVIAHRTLKGSQHDRVETARQLRPIRKKLKKPLDIGFAKKVSTAARSLAIDDWPKLGVRVVARR
jgi:hypothetical protein